MILINKLIKRKAYATILPTVEYSLTDKGRDFEPVLVAIQEWGLKYTVATPPATV